ncbi:probable serine/threonine-protein kinase nek3 [Parasteatoda tepidariorum]|nr:endochitinase A [Parasteatoda tepidariorum]
MRREDYARTYGRRTHGSPPPLQSPQDDHRRSRTKMKCLISIGLILPALAAVIGVAAWAVSADVVMNSGNSRNKADNHMMQNFPMESDHRRDIFGSNEESDKIRPQNQMPESTTKLTTTTTTTTTTAKPTTQSSTTITTTTSTTSAPGTLSPKEENDVNAILSKLISASGAASGGTGPRFVVVAPLPDGTDAFQSPPSTSTISRADHSQKSRDNSWHVSGPSRHESDLQTSASSHSKRIAHSTANQPIHQKNLTNRIGASTDGSSNRRIGPQPIVISANDYHNGNTFNGPEIEITGFDPFDSMMQDALSASPSAPKVHQSPNHPTYNNKRGPPQGIYGNRKPLPLQTFDHKPQQVFDPHMMNQNKHTVINSHNPGLVALPPGMGPPPSVGLKPIQKQMHHADPLQAAESNRWGYHGPPGGSYHHKPPEGISLSISSPSHSGTHVSASEPVSVIKSFFLPFLPKPRLNMNARVVFGVVLDKGMGLGGGKKDAGHHPYH